MSMPVQFHRGPYKRNLRTAPKITKVEALLIQFFGQQLHATRLVIQRLRSRIESDEAIMEHVQILQTANWPNWAIKETLIMKPYPPVSEILRLQKLLQDSGMQEADAIRVIALAKSMCEVHDIDEFDRKSKIARDHHPFDTSRTMRDLMRQATLIATHSEAELSAAAEQLRQRNISPSLWMIELQKALRKKSARQSS